MSQHELLSSRCKQGVFGNRFNTMGGGRERSVVCSADQEKSQVSGDGQGKSQVSVPRCLWWLYSVHILRGNNTRLGRYGENQSAAGVKSALSRHLVPQLLEAGPPQCLNFSGIAILTSSHIPGPACSTSDVDKSTKQAAMLKCHIISFVDKPSRSKQTHKTLPTRVSKDHNITQLRLKTRRPKSHSESTRNHCYVAPLAPGLPSRSGDPSCTVPEGNWNATAPFVGAPFFAMRRLSQFTNSQEHGCRDHTERKQGPADFSLRPRARYRSKTHRGRHLRSLRGIRT